MIGYFNVGVFLRNHSFDSRYILVMLAVSVSNWIQEKVITKIDNEEELTCKACQFAQNLTDMKF